MIQKGTQHPPSDTNRLTKKRPHPPRQPGKPNKMEKHYGYGGKTGDIHSKHTDAPHLNTKMIQKGTQHPPSDTNRLTKKRPHPPRQPGKPNKMEKHYGYGGKTGDIHSKHTDAPHLNTKMIQKGTQHPPLRH